MAMVMAMIVPIAAKASSFMLVRADITGEGNMDTRNKYRTCSRFLIRSCS